MRKLVIYLYSAIPQELGHQQQTFSKSRQVKRWLRRLHIRLNWKFRHKLVGHYTDLTSENFANRGDIALSIAAREHLSACLAPTPLEFREIVWGQLSPTDIKELNERADAFIIGGGGFFFFSPAGRFAADRITDCNLIPTITCPVFCFGTGANMLQSDDVKVDVVLNQNESAALKRLGEAIRFGTVRDRLAAQLLGAGGADLVQTVDPAFLLNSTEVSTQIERVDGKLNVGINLAVHGNFAYSLQKTTIAEYFPFLKALSNRDDIRLHYFVHEHGEITLASLLKGSGIKFEMVDLPAEKMLGAYAAMDMHICQMMHSAIFSTSAAIPTLCLSYDIKHIMLFEALGLEEWCLPASGVTTAHLVERFDALSKQCPDIQARLKNRKLELAQEYDAALKKMALAILHQDNTVADIRP